MFEYALLAAKILHYANGRSAFPSWTPAKDVPDGTLQKMIDITDKAPETTPRLMPPWSSKWPSITSST